MLKQRLNRTRIDEKLKSSGLNQSDIAKELDISRESVSKWFSEDCFPRPRHLLALSNFLDLDYSEVVIEEPDENEPVIAYRKVHNKIYSKEDKEKVVDIGYSLEKLLPFINNNKISITLPNPQNNSDYIKDIVKYIKNKYSINSNVISVEEIQKIFKDCDAFLIPVLWGESDNKTNGIHIRLPESRTDWIYINLDSSIYDIKFWMLHELCHLISSDIKEKYSEEFADYFAAEFLFSLDEAEIFYKSLRSTRNEDILARLFEKALELFISPYTIYKQINKYLKSANLKEIDIPKVSDTFKESLRPAQNITLTELFFKKKTPEPEEYINLIESNFSKEFINALVAYSDNERFSVGFVQNIFHISLQDARNIYLVIKARGLKNIGCNN